MREAIKQISELNAFLNATSDTAQGKELTETRSVGPGVGRRTKGTDMEDDTEERGHYNGLVLSVTYSGSVYFAR